MAIHLPELCPPHLEEMEQTGENLEPCSRLRPFSTPPLLSHPRFFEQCVLLLVGIRHAIATATTGA